MDFSTLKYDISKVPENEYVIDHFPELGEHKEFSDRKQDKILRFVILLVDDGSPFFKLHRDFSDRAKAVYSYRKSEDKVLKQYINGECKDDKFRIDVNGKIYKYFIILDKHTYTAWYSIWSNFQELNAFLQINIDPLDDQYETKFEKKQKITAMLPAMQKQLADYEKMIFGDTKIKQIVVNAVAKATYWPEKMVKKEEYISAK